MIFTIMNENYVIDHILKLYDLDIKSSYNYRKGNELSHPKLRVTTEVIFTPKKITTMTPEVAIAKGVWEYRFDKWRPGYSDSFEDMRRITKDKMPLLPYIDGRYELDNFCEKITKKEYLNIKEKYF
jgi:hypothetical protein